MACISKFSLFSRSSLERLALPKQIKISINPCCEAHKQPRVNTKKATVKTNVNTKHKGEKVSAPSETAVKSEDFLKGSPFEMSMIF